ncbi:putative transcription factor bHLH041 [Aegilops tauschii subsp. strangulata]|uniref:putative transcription factor bHLH041 n=1 Tax=Aegilops tauschii subsp. strangulata TaxID=200361 RepID=UPI00098B4D09|nr:putative transcription factor bHLH041 [Aegilops tauschii subsp. strangulata]
MDSVFALAAVPRALVLERAAARVPGCLYLCLWAPVTAQLPSSHLFCLDAWIGGGGGGGGSRARASFEAYRGALCAVVSGCVPGWAYREGRAYMELPEPDLTASASLQVQQQFYHEAGTKMAVFMGCESGEVEIGLSTTSVAAAAVADHVHQSFLEDLLQLPPAGLSSSSSPVPSLSIGSPEYSSLIRAMATPVAAPGESSTQPPMMQASPLPGLLAPIAEANDYALMVQAMLAVVPSSGMSTTSTPPLPPCPPWLASHRSQRSSPRRTTAFKPYRAALPPRARPRPGAPGQRMIKTCISLLASVHMAMRNRPEHATARREDSSAPSTTSQLHHVISERRRRERLNDSFQTLRALLPPGSKKDKANVLASTTEYMAKLVSQVTQLRERNLQLEAQLGLNQSASDDNPSGKTVEVEVTTGASTSTSTAPSQQPREVSVRVTVRAECDMSEVLTSLLARLKDTGSFAVVSVEARQQSSALARASLTLRMTEVGDVVDEAWLEEALAKVVEDAVMKTPPVPPPRSP